MSDDNLPRKTWSRIMEPVSKLGYMDGATEGRASVFQQSFNIAYEQGLQFGLELGFKDAMSRVQNIPPTRKQILQDTRLINCQLCINGVPAEDNIGNLYNYQKEKNAEILCLL